MTIQSEFFEAEVTPNENSANQADAAKENTHEASTNEYLEALVGEGKKFKSIEELAYGKAKADEYIEETKKKLSQYEEQFKEMTKKIESLETIKEYIDMDNSYQQRQHQETNKQGSVQDHVRQSSAVNVEEVVKLALAQIENKDKEEARKNNLNSVRSTLVSQYGKEDAVKLLGEKSAELGIPEKQLLALASDSPKAFYKLIGINVEQSAANTRTSYTGQNSHSFKTPTNGVKDAGYYQEMAKTDPLEFLKPSTQMEFAKLMLQTRKN